MPDIRLLGPLEVRRDDVDVTPRRLKQRALLAALALRVGTPVTPDRLVDELWGEHAPKTARHALENYVFELRKALGKDVIGTRPNGYVLDVAPEDVDVVRFERLLADARSGSAPDREERLREALSLVRGEPLADLAFQPFAQVEASRLVDLAVGAREELIEAELEQGRGAELVGELEKLVAAHPFRERLRGHLMVALYRAGRQAEALEAYQDARRTLVDELGIDPSEELQELERAILRQDTGLRPPPRIREVAEAPPADAPRRPARKTVTVVRAALANSAALAERLDAEQLRAVLDRYLDVARTAVARHGGARPLVAGDTVVGIFGVPAAHEDDALRAVRAAVELREGVGLLNDGLLPESGVFLELRIGIDTGEVLVAGADEPATGRAVAGAEALERAAQAGQILLGAAAYELVRGVAEAEEIRSSEDPQARSAYRLVELQPDVYGRALRLDSAIVGRRRQLAALATAFEHAASDRAFHLFTLLGPAGVGKSRLVRELVESVGGVARVLQGRCLPYGEGITYYPLREALRDAWSEELEVTPESVRASLEALARERPLLVVLEDLQWAEPPLLDLIEAIAESSRGAPILVVCVARLELLETRPAWSGGKHNASSLLLEPLSEAESERLIDNLLGDSDLADPVRDYVVRSAEGNPLFLEELLAALVDREILLKHAGRWTTTEIPAIPVPPSIQALVAARIDRLPAEERLVLERASIQGKEFTFTAVSVLVGDELGGGVDASLAALVRKELVRPAEVAGAFEFRHQVIRDAAYASLPMRERIGLHERLATWLAASDGVDSGPQPIAQYHLDQATRYRQALGLPETNPTAT